MVEGQGGAEKAPLRGVRKNAAASRDISISDLEAICY